MPLYEYECENCGERFEVLEKFSDEPLRTHEKCGGAVHRLISAPAFQFKGSGWYITDYAKSKSSGASAENGAPPAKTDSNKSTSSDAGASTTPASTTPSESKSTSDTKTSTKSGSDTKSG
jgi:putative FmdB family regulatory protein